MDKLLYRMCEIVVKARHVKIKPHLECAWDHIRYKFKDFCTATLRGLIDREIEIQGDNWWRSFWQCMGQ
jgi:hypothetical protein